MFTVNDKVVCIDNIFYDDNISEKFNLTIGKTYIVEKIITRKHIVMEKSGGRITYELHIVIEDDKREHRHFLMNRFIPLTEYRKMKLDKIKKGLIN